MRNTLIFAGSSCPALTHKICENLGMTPAEAELTQFSNGETSVKIMKSVREKDVFVVQSGSPQINDTIMELLIMISACKGGSATKITAVLPYLPYGRQSKRKAHRGAITARLFANLLTVAGVKHVISVDLHASQMQGFFQCPIDNLHAEPLLARWIRHNVPNWQDGVVVSKNAGGTKRVTSLADALKLSFGIITTDKRRSTNMSVSTIMNRLDGMDLQPFLENSRRVPPRILGGGDTSPPQAGYADLEVPPTPRSDRRGSTRTVSALDTNPSSSSFEATTPRRPSPSPNRGSAPGDGAAQYDDHLVQDVTHGRLVQGRIVDDDYPSTSDSPTNNSVPDEDPMTMSRASSFFAAEGESLGGSDDGGALSDVEEDVLEDPKVEHMITLVGNVKNKPVFIVDDMIDKPQSWIAAAETVIKRGHAKQVYCMATHGVFGGDCLRQLQACESIHAIVVTNSFPINREQAQGIDKLIVLDLSNLLSEAIRRNHYGESISPLFQHMD